ncbi:MAG: DUF4296 domain-containing protein [Algoriphagus sp.]|uniref:DUF4296 domain-containing protein n=1 Tax=Algoriphagus sp. TaxID=1872435 RepID=UPI0017CB4CB0|nr:DUF4296 domain-containing protein [Algoriphagus sp.]NVJ87333.1 DUF4296 domain-containing protein [Algoriphagus sp.]
MKSQFWAILTLFLLLGCESKKKQSPLLSEDEMVSILIDIHLTEGIASALPISYDSSQTVYSLMELEVFKKHGVEDSIFHESLRYYLQFPDEMDKLYARVIDSLVVKESAPESQESF